MNSRSGQSMLIAVLSLGGAMLVATTIAGLLILYQLRATTDSVHSSQAIFAADSGIDRALFSYYCKGDSPARQGCPPGPLTRIPSTGAGVSVTCYTADGTANPCTSSTTSYVFSKGTSLNTSRAFYLLMTAATTTFP